MDPRLLATRRSGPSSRSYAERFATRWLILSGKYGFVDPEFQIPGPYDVTFSDPATHPIAMSALEVQALQLRLHQYQVVIGLGSKEYRDVIRQALARPGMQLEFPFAGLDLFAMMAATKLAIRRGDPLPAQRLTPASEHRDAPDQRRDRTPQIELADPRPRGALNREVFSRELASMLRREREAGQSYVVITAGELHRRVGHYPGRDHRMPICCRVMRESMGPSDAILRQPPKGNGASLAIQYRFDPA